MSLADRPEWARDLPDDHAEMALQRGLFTIEAASAYLLGTAKGTLRKLKKAGKLHPVRLGKRDLFPKAELDAILGLGTP